jgi:NADH-quinone oxidoreductase subunit M
VSIELSLPIFIPVAAGVLGLLAPPRLSRWIVLFGTVCVLGYAIVFVAEFAQGAGGLRYRTNVDWIPSLGIHYALGLDGLSLFLVALTAVLWVFATLAAALREWERPRLFFFHLGLAETAVLGAFCAQDLALFVAFFDLMLVPFYFLVGQWGGFDRIRATTKFVIYTLVGSLLMLSAAVGVGVLATPEGGQVSFLLSDLRERALPAGSQDWIFLFFAAAFLVKAPLFPVHGWMPDAYRATPGPVLALLSGVLSKVGVYGFLRIVLPIAPDGAARFQELVLILAVISILYGSVVAFSQDSARLVVGYSSVAQLGFITLGIFSFEPLGAQGAVLQMVTHGLVAGALFLIIPLLADRAGGSELLSRMGGVALRGPVLAALFLIVAFATLAMPGSPNFVGEILILFGALESKIAYGVVASFGVVLAAVYMIRLYQRAMHYRVGAAVEPREMPRGDLLAVAPLVAVIVALGVYPQLVLGRTERDVTAQVEKPAQVAGGEPARAEVIR